MGMYSNKSKVKQVEGGTKTCTLTFKNINAMEDNNSKELKPPCVRKLKENIIIENIT